MKKELEQNGLCYIRTQCNFSQNYLAEKLGVTRQLISAWEKGEKNISDKRLKQLSEFFGVKEPVFTNFSPEMKTELKDVPRYHFNDCEKEYFLYHKGTSKAEQIPYFYEERSNTFNEELLGLQMKKKQILDKIDSYVNGPSNMVICNRVDYQKKQIDKLQQILDPYIYID